MQDQSIMECDTAIASYTYIRVPKKRIRNSNKYDDEDFYAEPSCSMPANFCIGIQDSVIELADRYGLSYIDAARMCLDIGVKPILPTADEILRAKKKGFSIADIAAVSFTHRTSISQISSKGLGVDKRRALIGHAPVSEYSSVRIHNLLHDIYLGTRNVAEVDTIYGCTRSASSLYNVFRKFMDNIDFDRVDTLKGCFVEDPYTTAERESVSVETVFAYLIKNNRLKVPDTTMTHVAVADMAIVYLLSGMSIERVSKLYKIPIKVCQYFIRISCTVDELKDTDLKFSEKKRSMLTSIKDSVIAYREGVSIQTIAQAIHVQRASVVEYLKKHLSEDELRSDIADFVEETERAEVKKKSRIDVGKVVALYNARWDIAKIADEMGCDESTIRKILIKCSIIK